jgi:hypothetical protein
VVGVTPSQSSRDVLAEAGVAESYNFAQFLGHLKDQRGARGPVKLNQGDLIVIDEASMFSNPDFADIVDYATRIGVKVAVALDHQQLQAVENGGGASLVTRKQGYVQLPEPVRFTEEWERSASLRLREGRISALADYAEHGRIRAGTAEEILEAAAQAYVAHTLEGKDSLVIARSHELRREACRRVRDDLQHLGLVARDGPSIEIADGQRATAGDLIVCTENDHSVVAGEGKTLANMHVLRIESITQAGPIVRRMLRPDPQTQAPRWTEEAFLFPGYNTAELAYAVTEQVAQGRTGLAPLWWTPSFGLGRRKESAMARPSRYPEEFRREAVQLALAADTSWASVARRLGVNETTLRNWVHAHLAEEARAADPLTVSHSESTTPVSCSGPGGHGRPPPPTRP